MSFTNLLFPFGDIYQTGARLIKGDVAGAVASYAKSVPGVVLYKVASKPIAYLGTGLVASFQKGAAASKTIAMAPKIASGISKAAGVYLKPAAKFGNVAMQATIRSTKALAKEGIRQVSILAPKVATATKAVVVGAKTAVVAAFTKGSAAAGAAFAAKTALGLGGAKAAIAAGSAFLTGIGPVGWAVLGTLAVGSVVLASLAMNGRKTNGQETIRPQGQTVQAETLQTK